MRAARAVRSGEATVSGTQLEKCENWSLVNKINKCNDVTGENAPNGLNSRKLLELFPSTRQAGLANLDPPRSGGNPRIVKFNLIRYWVI